MSGNVFKSQSKLNVPRQRKQQLFAMQEIGFFSSHSNGVFHPFEIVPRKVFILTWALIAFALGVWSNLDFQQCFCRLIVWQQVLLLPCFTKRRPGWSYLRNAGVLLGKFGSRSVPMATMARLCQSHHDPPPPDERGKSVSARLQIPNTKCWSPSATIHKVDNLCCFWHTQMAPRSWQGASAVTRGTGEDFFFWFTLFSCFMAEESRAYKSHCINLSQAGLCTDTLPDRSISACAD